jgi:hypothetical protein
LPTVTAPPAGDGIPSQLRFRAADRTPATRPAALPAERFLPYQVGCRRIITSLRAWLSEHADTEVETRNGVELLGNLRWAPPDTDGQLPLHEILRPWWERIAPSLSDGGVEAALLYVTAPHRDWQWAQRAAAGVVGVVPGITEESPLVQSIVYRMAEHEFRQSWIDVLLDAVSQLCSDLPLDGLRGPSERMARDGRTSQALQSALIDHADARAAFPDFEPWLLRRELSPAQLERLWRLVRFRDEPEGAIDVFDGPKVAVTALRTVSNRPTWVEFAVPDQPVRMRPTAELLGRAFDAGIARRGDVLDALIDLNDDVTGSRNFFVGRRTGIEEFTARRLPPWAASPAVQAEVSVVQDAVVAGEVARGDLPGPLTPTARRLRSARGVHSLARVLQALGSRPLTRGHGWTETRDSMLSGLARIHLPAAGDDVAAVGEAFRSAAIDQRRVIEYAVYAPHWAALIEQHLGWPGFESAVWWVHAHSKDASWSVDRQIREEWQSAVSQRTPLDSVELMRGATDVSWFADLIAELGAERFDAVLAAAKYAAAGRGHKRAQLFAGVLLGRVTESELRQQITAKRHQDAVRALGLLPLSGRSDPALLDRYETLRGFVATDRTSGPQRRTVEATAVAVGLENLARTAGYRDPQQLVWAMEAEAVRDLVAGPVTAIDGDVTVTLSLDSEGSPAVSVSRADRALKSIPAKSSRAPAIAELTARAAALSTQVTRMRRSLEQACVSGHSFSVTEFAQLLRHPILGRMLRDVVLISDEGMIGFAGADAGHLLGPDGQPRVLDGSPLMIAHPIDLLRSGEWPDLQHRIFSAGRRQPFRQLFRELYIPTATELADGLASRRFAGHQVERSRAAGIFASRGWVADFEVGFARTFHQEKITAECSWPDVFGTAADIGDARIEEVTFHRTGSWQPMPLSDVPPRVFSETMRDLDLVVSIAHAGGVDPKTSESTIQMRRRLVEETVELLGLDNVEVSGHHARIRGKLGRYSVQLGSGQVHRIPGNAVCIVAVSAQHRGRVFLPFADDDPRTAEVISKVLLLARDDTITDPSVREQLA